MIFTGGLSLDLSDIPLCMICNEGIDLVRNTECKRNFGVFTKKLQRALSLIHI